MCPTLVCQEPTLSGKNTTTKAIKSLIPVEKILKGRIKGGTRSTQIPEDPSMEHLCISHNGILREVEFPNLLHKMVPVLCGFLPPINETGQVRFPPCWQAMWAYFFHPGKVGSEAMHP